MDKDIINDIYFRAQMRKLKDPSLRLGQAFMAVLYEVSQEYYHLLTKSDYDCFYDDGKIGVASLFLATTSLVKNPQ